MYGPRSADKTQPLVVRRTPILPSPSTPPFSLDVVVLDLRVFHSRSWVPFCALRFTSQGGRAAQPQTLVTHVLIRSDCLTIDLTVVGDLTQPL